MSDYERREDCDKKDDFERKDSCFHCVKPGHPLPKPIIFECGNGGGFTFTSPDNECESCCCEPKTIAHVTVDTSCLCLPKIKIEFSSIVSFIPKSLGHAQLEFDLVRCCKDFPECVIGTWSYEIDGEDDRFTKSFCFDYCECQSCPGCCTYLVRCRPVFVKHATVCVTNCQIAVFAQGN